MRKILLATTAIASTFAVASANAEVSISGGAAMSYTSVSDDLTRTATSDETLGFTDNTITISFSSVTDNGLTLGYSQGIDGDTTKVASISGDFGTIQLGDSAHAAESYDVTSPSMFGGHGDIHTAPESAAGTDVTGVRYNEADLGGLGNDANNISYHSPSINGFSFGIGIGSLDSTDDVTSAGAMYSADMGGAAVTIGVAQTEGAANVKGEHAGAQVSFSGLTIGVGSSSTETSTTSKEETTSVGITYQVNDQLKVGAGTVNSDNTLASKEMTTNSVSVSYTIASGLVAHLGHNQFEYKSSGSTVNDGSIMEMGLSMSF
jgi:hypothetical protein